MQSLSRKAGFDLSIVITTKNRHKSMLRTLDALLSQITKDHKTEIIIVEETNDPQPVKEEGVKYQTLLKRLKIPTSTLSFYLNHLLKAKMILRHHIGREHIYTIADKDAIMKLLVTYKSSFIDRLIDNVTSTWMEMHS